MSQIKEESRKATQQAKENLRHVELNFRASSVMAGQLTPIRKDTPSVDMCHVFHTNLKKMKSNVSAKHLIQCSKATCKREPPSRRIELPGFQRDGGAVTPTRTRKDTPSVVMCHVTQI